MNTKSINEAAESYAENFPLSKYEREMGFEAGVEWVMQNFDDYLETYYEIVERVTLALETYRDCVVTSRYAEQGRGGMYELAKEWTGEIQSLYGDREWNGEWLETLDEFFNSKNELK